MVGHFLRPSGSIWGGGSTRERGYSYDRDFPFEVYLGKMPHTPNTSEIIFARHMYPPILRADIAISNPKYLCLHHFCPSYFRPFPVKVFFLNDITDEHWQRIFSMLFNIEMRINLKWLFSLWLYFLHQNMACVFDDKHLISARRSLGLKVGGIRLEGREDILTPQSSNPVVLSGSCSYVSHGGRHTHSLQFSYFGPGDFLYSILVEAFFFLEMSSTNWFADHFFCSLTKRTLVHTDRKSQCLPPTQCTILHQC